MMYVCVLCMIVMQRLGKLSSPEELQEDLKSSDWIKVPYKCNRGIVHGKCFDLVPNKTPHLLRAVAGLVVYSYVHILLCVS